MSPRGVVIHDPRDLMSAKLNYFLAPRIRLVYLKLILAGGSSSDFKCHSNFPY